MKQHDEYLATVDRLEPEISPVDTAGALTSIAISLCRIADALEASNERLRDVWEALTSIEVDLRRTKL